jgi:hypothetical protein
MISTGKQADGEVKGSHYSGLQTLQGEYPASRASHASEKYILFSFLIFSA